jgi:hypothetical protein
MSSSWAEQNRARESDRTGETVQDCLFLGLVALLSVVYYVARLGFYSDDWIFLSLLHQADTHTVADLFQALYDGDVVIRQRPVQMFYLVWFYKIFGLHPIAYHLGNSIALLLSVILLYLVIREFGRQRVTALAISVVYLLLPHYSTDRFWMAAHQATFSILFYFLSLYADLRAYREYPHHFKWKMVGVLAIILSGLSYEVAIPLFVINPFLVWYGKRAMDGDKTKKLQSWSQFLALFAVNYVTLLVVIAFKLQVTVRTNVEAGLAAHVMSIIMGALRVNFGTYGLALPYVVSWILFHQRNGLLLLLSGLAGLIIFFYLRVMTSRSAASTPERWLVIIVSGLIIFGCGYAIFVVNADVWFTSTSLGNRVAIASAIGVAIFFVGVIGWICSILPRRTWGQTLFCLSISVLAASGFLINNTLASNWIAAYQDQQKIMNNIQQKISSFPAGSTFILDGLCFQQGGAYLFTGKRDLTSALSITYEDPNLNATVLSSSAKIGEQGLSITTYNLQTTYPYGEDLLIYNFGHQKLYSLVDADTARQYFKNTDFIPEKDCPPGFAWGWNE